MYLQHIKLMRVRNLSQTMLDFVPHLNIIYGKNGSGKTSLLEAIHLLTTGRSFRSAYAHEFIAFNASDCVLSGKTHPLNVNQGTSVSIGLERYRKGGMAIQINHQKCSSIAKLAQVLPLQMINTESYSLLEGSSRFRRQFVDWGMFHVEPQFFPVWHRYTRALKQRNAALKRAKFEGVSSVVAWNKELIELGCSLHDFRQEFLGSFAPLLSDVLGEILQPQLFSFRYKQGWSENLKLSEALEARLELDVIRGFTSQGPHRADLALMLGESFVETVLSRGQQKLLICALHIARAKWLFEKTGRRGLFLVDDLNSELDKDSSEWFLRNLIEMGGQVIITTIDPSIVTNFIVSTGLAVNVMHVEGGNVTC